MCQVSMLRCGTRLDSTQPLRILLGRLRTLLPVEKDVPKNTVFAVHLALAALAALAALDHLHHVHLNTGDHEKARLRFPRHVLY